MAGRTDRRYKAGKDTDQLGDARGEFRKDHDRLYYTPSFLRLTGVTQVAAPHSEIAPVHNRYIHSDKVAQIGRALAEYLLKEHAAVVQSLGGLDPDVVAAAGLAHDIGHPPFGHAGEKVLHELALSWGIDGFEGNAQTFRILTKLAVKDESFPGLDLTRATRNAVLKYPWAYGEGPTPELVQRHQRKWCIYRSERPDFEEARSGHPLPNSTSGEPSQSVEAALMELADDISYALHDFEDFYRAGLISLSALRRSDNDFAPKSVILAEVQRALRDRFDHGVAEEAWAQVLDWFDNPIVSSLGKDYVGSSEQDAALVRLTSFQISKFIDGVQLDAGANHPVVVDPAIEHEIIIWKQLTWQWVINRPGFGAVQTGQAALVRRTAEVLHDWISADGPESRRLPRRLRDYYQLGIFDQDNPEYPNPVVEHVIARALIDYIASLTEPEMVALHDQLTGSWRSSMLHGGVL